MSATTPDCRAIRMEHGLSQSELAARLGLPVRTVQDWEQGQRRMSAPAVALLRLVQRFPQALQSA